MNLIDRQIRMAGADYPAGRYALEAYGGDDGTRTRGLCRDRAATTCNLLDFNGTDSPFLIL